MINKQKVACIGAGYFSQFHYDAWNRIEGAQLVASVDSDRQRAAHYSDNAYAGIDEMLALEKPDIVDIISPPHTHLEMIQKCVAANITTVICQKPFCGSLASAHMAVEVAEEKGTLLVVHENFRFQPWYRTIKQALDEGKIGDLLQITFRLRPGDGQGKEAYLGRQPYFQKMPRFLMHETGIHWIDTFRYLMGEPAGVYADVRRCNPVIAGEDAGYFIFDYEDGTRALFDGNRLADHVAENTRQTMGEALVEGTAGTIYLNGEGMVTLRKFGSQSEEILLGSQEQSGFGGDCVHAIQQHVIDHLTKGTPLENAASDYLRNMEIEEKVYISAVTGQRLSLE